MFRGEESTEAKEALLPLLVEQDPWKHMLTDFLGIVAPTSGTAIIGGYDICQDIAGVRKSLGICPQHNILFDDLTVEEHIYFFCKLKGLAKDEIKEEISKFLKILELEPKVKIIILTYLKV